MLEPGCVLKATNGAKLSIYGPVSSLGSAYKPCVFTAVADTSVGETIGSNTNLNGYYADVALELNATTAQTNYILQHLHIRHARTAISLNGYNGHEFRHLQLVNCQNGLKVTGTTNFAVRNALFHQVLTNFSGSATGSVEHLTVNTANWLSYSNQVTLSLTNCLLAAVGNGTNVTLSSVSMVTNASGVFQSVGAGYNYPDAAYRIAGTSVINPGLATELARMTVHPPVVLTNHFTVSTNLAPQAPRDTNSFWRGYHYWPLDYCLSGLKLTNSTLVLTNGVALGVYGGVLGSGLSLDKSSVLISEGNALSLNRIASYTSVQEQPASLWATNTVAPALRVAAASPAPQVQCRFTEFSVPGGAGDHVNCNGFNINAPFGFTHCQFYGGGFLGEKLALSLTNCVWHRVNVSLQQASGSAARYAYNNLFYGGSVDIEVGGSGSATFYDNLFDRTTLVQSGDTVTHGYNGYVTNSGRLTPNQSTDKVLTNAPVYLTGALGRFYYPTNDGMLSLLIDAGSRNATNAGLYHFVTVTNQIQEAATQVDIGFHYVAVTNGAPFDPDNDGLASYLEDRNGNGVQNTGEPNFNDGDSDYDGRNDGQEFYTDSTDPTSSSSVVSVALGYWRFNITNNWVGEQGQLPKSSTNVQGASSWNGFALKVEHASVANLKYQDVEANQSANINCRNGTVRFWFKPNWNSATTNSGNGPQSEARLIELGTKATPATDGWWGLLINTNGTNISFGTQTNSAARTNLTFTINWSSNAWHQLVLTYSPTNSAVYIDGQPTATNGLAVAHYPSASVRSADGFSLGSNKGGTEQAKALFDELETFNFPKTATQVLDEYNQADSDGDGVPNIKDIQSNDPTLGELKITIDNPPKNPAVY